MQQPTILFGNSEENFYQIGKRDKTSILNQYKEIDLRLHKYKVTQELSKKLFDLSHFCLSQHGKNNFKELKAYSKGIGLEESQVLFYLLLPEIVNFSSLFQSLLSSFHSINTTILFKNKNNSEVFHGFLLNNQYQVSRQSIVLKLTNKPQIAFNTNFGSPYPFHRAINEYGLSFSLHQIATPLFVQQGTPIFEILFRMLNKCKNTTDAIKFLRKSISLTGWKVILSDNGDNIAEVDLYGEEILVQTYNINDHQQLIFSGTPLKSSLGVLSGHREKIKSNHQIIKQKLKNFDFNHKNTKNNFLKKISNSKLSSSEVSLQSSKLFFLSSQNNQYAYYENFLKTKEYKTLALEHSIDPKLILIQEAFDKNNTTELYHLLQIRIFNSTKNQETKKFQFFFLLVQYIHEFDDRDLISIYEEMNLLDLSFSLYLEEQRLAFLSRLELILGLPASAQNYEFSFNDIKSKLKADLNFGALKVKQMKRFIKIRFDIPQVYIP